jgi:hypothetical protein
MADNQLKLENKAADIIYNVDFKNSVVSIRTGGGNVLPLNDLLSIAAIYKAQVNETNARIRKETAIRMFGAQGALNFREK